MKERIKIFISSRQINLANERRILRHSIESDTFLQKHCEAILFEKEPPPSLPSAQPYLEILNTCHAYFLIIGDDYGNVDINGISPIHQEYRLATALFLPIIVFIKGYNDTAKSSEINGLIDEIICSKTTFKRFDTDDELEGEAKRAIKKMLKDMFDISQPIIIESPDPMTVLQRFSPVFLKHDPSETSVVNYYNWHESITDFLDRGNGLLSTITYGEIYNLWTDDRYFPGYESKLLLLKKQGGHQKRTFVIPNDVTYDPSRIRLFCRVLMRHIRLEFDPKNVPKVKRVSMLEAARSELGINCSMFGTLNGKFAYFFLFEKDQMFMVRTTHKETVIKASNLATLFYNKAHSAIAFVKDHEHMIPPEDIERVNYDISLVQHWNKYE